MFLEYHTDSQKKKISDSSHQLPYFMYILKLSVIVHVNFHLTVNVVETETPKPKNSSKIFFIHRKHFIQHTCLCGPIILLGHLQHLLGARSTTAFSVVSVIEYLTQSHLYQDLIRVQYNKVLWHGPLLSFCGCCPEITLFVPKSECCYFLKKLTKRVKIPSLYLIFKQLNNVNQGNTSSVQRNGQGQCRVEWAFR